MGLRRTSWFKLPTLVSNRPDNAYITPPSLDHLERAMDYPDCGVFVFWGPFMSGKTEGLSALDERLRSKGRRVEAYNAASFEPGMRIYSWFLEQLTCIPGCSSSSIHLNTVLPEALPGNRTGFSCPATTFIIDHFDRVMDAEDLKSVEGFVVNYAQQSVSGKRFNILLAVSSVSNAELILSWNGCTKIMLAMRPECARWNVSYFKDLISALLSHTRTEWSSDKIELLLQFCVKGGSPKFLRGLLYAGPDHFGEYLKVAEVADSEWKEGCRTLSKLFMPWF